MFPCFFVSDLHGRRGRYQALWACIGRERPRAVFCGGDLLPMGLDAGDFVADFLIPGFDLLRQELGPDYPRIFVILGNDDPRALEEEFTAAERDGLWEYIHGRKVALGKFVVFGYSYVPPTPFQLKDWEKYDVSQFVDPGCVSPEEGRRSVPVPIREIRYATIARDLEDLIADLAANQATDLVTNQPANADLQNAIFLFHTPPYGCGLDRAALDGKTVDHVPVDPHVGSIAVQRFIGARQPLLTLHGHVHEAVRLTGIWREMFGLTTVLTAAHDGSELALVRFDPALLAEASRELIPVAPDGQLSAGV